MRSLMITIALFGGHQVAAINKTMVMAVEERICWTIVTQGGMFTDQVSTPSECRRIEMSDGRNWFDTTETMDQILKKLDKK